jgi:hypothetical protein
MKVRFWAAPVPPSYDRPRRMVFVSAAVPVTSAPRNTL